MKKKILNFLIEWIGFIYLLILGKSLRWEEHGYEKVKDYLPDGCVLPFWHNRILMVAYFMRNRNTAAIISRHSDGEIIARIASHFGHQPVRGSTGKGGAEAMTIMEEMVRNGSVMGITPDGPLGPKYKLQPGTIRLAERTFRPIIPILIGVERKKILKSWDGFQVPRLFSRARVYWGEPVWILDELDEQDFEKKRIEVEKIMMKLVEMADSFE